MIIWSAVFTAFLRISAVSKNDCAATDGQIGRTTYEFECTTELEKYHPFTSLDLPVGCCKEHPRGNR